MKYIFGTRLIFQLFSSLITFFWELHKVTVSMLGIILIGLLFSALHFSEKSREIEVLQATQHRNSQEIKSLEKQLAITEKGLQIYPNHPTLLYNAFVLQEALDNTQQATEYRLRLEEFHPNFEK